MKTIDKFIKTIRLKTTYFFIQKNVKNILASQVHCIRIDDIKKKKVNIEYSLKPIGLEDYYWIDTEQVWKKTSKKAEKFFSKQVSSWQKEQYELIEESELMAMISGRPVVDMQKDPAQETLYFDGYLVIKLTRFINQIEINTSWPVNDEISFSKKGHLITLPNSNKLEKTWNERIDHLKKNMGLKEIDKAFIEEKYKIIEAKEKYKQLVFAEDNKAEQMAIEEKKAKEAEEKRRNEIWEKNEEKYKMDDVFFPDNKFVRHLKDWGENFCHFAGAKNLYICEDDEIKGDDILPEAGDWVVYDQRGLSGTYGVSHEDSSIYTIKIKKPQKHGINYKTKPLELCLSTVDLMHRYKWMSRLMNNHTFDVDYANPLYYWDDIESIEEAYQKEKDYLKDDSYLALYWLMHFGFIMDKRYNDIKKLVAGMDEHEYLQDCIIFFDVLEKHPNFSVDAGSFHRKDTEEYRHRFEIKRAYAVHLMHSYDYISHSVNIKRWWNSISLYPKAEQYLIRRIKWLKNNLVKYNAWEEFNEIIKNEPVSEYCLMHYVQFFNPVESDAKKQNATLFLKELKNHTEIWQEETEKKFAAKMIHDVHNAVSDKGLLKEMIEYYCEDKESDDYTSVIELI